MFGAIKKINTILCHQIKYKMQRATLHIELKSCFNPASGYVVCRACNAGS